MSTPTFTDAPLVDIVRYVQASVGTARFVVLDPDRGEGRFAGEVIVVDGTRYVHRPFRVWVDLAERLHRRLAMPRRIDDTLVELSMAPLTAADPLRAAASSEKYGTGSAFSRIAKLEDPGYVLDLADALERAELPERASVLDLGCNDAQEVALIRSLLPERTLAFVGIDHSATAIEQARARYSSDRFVCADLSELAALELGRFDLVISIATLHSPGVDDREVLRQVVQSHVTPGGAVIIGVPNCRYADGEVLHGARTKNFTQPELSLLIKSVGFYKKYLQQHRFRVFVTGKNYILVTGARRSTRDDSSGS